MDFKPLLVSLFGFSLLFPKVIFAQLPKNNYEKQWKLVDELIKKEQPKSALSKVNSIYALAKKDKQDAQVIKALVYMIDLQNETTENSGTKSFAEIDREIGTANEPSKSILNSLLAGM